MNRRRNLITSPLDWFLSANPVSPPAIPVLAERGGTQLKTPRPVIVVDTREQNPFDFSRFEGWFSGVERKTLKLGDYSIAGLEEVCTVLWACTFEFPGDPATLISCTQTGLSVALPQEHFELPGEVLLDLVGVLISNLHSQDKQSGEAVKRSFGKFLSNINANINPNHSVPSDVLAKLGVEAASSGKFISADIPEHPTGALGIYGAEEQGMAYRIVDFFNLLLKEEDYLGGRLANVQNRLSLEML